MTKQINIFMRIAILLSGQPRFTQDFFLFLSNLTGYDQADWFVYITNNNHPNSLSLISKDWMNFEPAWAREKIQSWLPINNIIQSLEISDHEQLEIFPVQNLLECNIENVQKQFYHIYRADMLRQQFETQNNFVYDLIIRTRPDLGLTSQVNLKDLNIQDSQIIMPHNDWHGTPKCNDQFAIGNSRNMKLYSDLFINLKRHNDAGSWFHPESILGYHLNSNGVQCIDGNFTTSLRTAHMVE
jgi:hypothetical protein